MVSQKEIIEEINKLIEASLDEVGYQYSLGKILQLANRIESEEIAPPDGWVLVPKEPTAEMIEAAIKNGAEGDENIILYITSDYKTMLAAAPKRSIR